MKEGKALDKTIKCDLGEEKKEISLNLRPTSFDDYIGQKEITDNLKVFIEACKKRNEPLDHILLYGQAGLGKTSLAYVIAKEMGVNIKVISAPAIEKAGEIASILNSLLPNDILFIDEIHRLPRAVEETLYSAMEDYAIDIIIGKGQQGKSIRLNLPKFTLIGATTRAGMITAPLRDRFGITFRFDYYKDDELVRLINRSFDILRCKNTEETARIIAGRSRGTPRIANKIVKRCCDFATVDNIETIDKAYVLTILDRLCISEDGLDDMDNLIITTIRDKFNSGPVGLSTLASAIGEDEDTLAFVYEPYLIYLGYIMRTPKGRILTEKIKGDV